MPLILFSISNKSKFRIISQRFFHHLSFFFKHTPPIFSSRFILISTPSVQSEHFNCSNTYHLLCIRLCHRMKGYCSEQITFSALIKIIDRRAVADWDSALKDLTLRLSYSKSQHRGQSLKSTWGMQEGDLLSSGVIAQGARTWWKYIQGLKCWWVPFFFTSLPLSIFGVDKSHLCHSALI